MGVDNAAVYLGVAKDSVYKWIEEQKLPALLVRRLFHIKLFETDKYVCQDNEQNQAVDLVQGKFLSKLYKENFKGKEQK